MSPTQNNQDIVFAPFEAFSTFTDPLTGTAAPEDDQLFADRLSEELHSHILNLNPPSEPLQEFDDPEDIEDEEHPLDNDTEYARSYGADKDTDHESTPKYWAIRITKISLGMLFALAMSAVPAFYAFLIPYSLAHFFEFAREVWENASILENAESVGLATTSLSANGPMFYGFTFATPARMQKLWRDMRKNKKEKAIGVVILFFAFFSAISAGAIGFDAFSTPFSPPMAALTALISSSIPNWLSRMYGVDQGTRRARRPLNGKARILSKYVAVLSRIVPDVKNRLNNKLAAIASRLRVGKRRRQLLKEIPMAVLEPILLEITREALYLQLQHPTVNIVSKQTRKEIANIYGMVAAKAALALVLGAYTFPPFAINGYKGGKLLIKALTGIELDDPSVGAMLALGTPGALPTVFLYSLVAWDFPDFIKDYINYFRQHPKRLWFGIPYTTAVILSFAGPLGVAISSNTYLKWTGTAFTSLKIFSSIAGDLVNIKSALSAIFAIGPQSLTYNNLSLDNILASLNKLEPTSDALSGESSYSSADTYRQLRLHLKSLEAGPEVHNDGTVTNPFLQEDLISLENGSLPANQRRTPTLANASKPRPCVRFSSQSPTLFGDVNKKNHKDKSKKQAKTLAHVPSMANMI